MGSVRGSQSRLYIGLEQEAVAITRYSAYYMPVLLQTAKAEFLASLSPLETLRRYLSDEPYAVDSRTATSLNSNARYLRT